MFEVADWHLLDWTYLVLGLLPVILVEFVQRVVVVA